MEKFYEFQKELEKIQEDVESNQADVQEKLNEFFTICPKIEDIKNAYARDKFPIESDSIKKDFNDKYLQNN